jgi:hypothetical protein
MRYVRNETSTHTGKRITLLPQAAGFAGGL